MSRHEKREKLAREFGATDVVTERGDEGMKRVKDMTKGVGADSVLECAGTQQSMTQAIHCTRKGGYVSSVGVPHGLQLDGTELFFSHVHLHGGPAPVRRYLPELIALVLDRKINPGKVFDLTLPLERVAEGYRAMGERRAARQKRQNHGAWGHLASGAGRGRVSRFDLPREERPPCIFTGSSRRSPRRCGPTRTSTCRASSRSSTS